MIERILVIPFDSNLFYRLGAYQSIVPVINKITDVRKTVETAREAGSKLHCVKVDMHLPLSAIVLPEDLQEVPIALYVSGLGRFSEFVDKIDCLKEMNVRVFMPSNARENLSASRILSSLGVENGLILNGNDLDWEALADLMTYALFARAPHAPIAPFNYTAARYDPGKPTDFSGAYFDDPGRFLHLDMEGRVALTSKDLERGEYLAEQVEELGDLGKNKAYLEGVSKWREIFLETDGCAYCPGWRICIGKFGETRKEAPGCTTFFSDFLDALDQLQETAQKGKTLWHL